jgi:hypothetical protein
LYVHFYFVLGYAIELGVPVSIYTVSRSTRPRYGLDVWNPAKYVFLSCPCYDLHYVLHRVRISRAPVRPCDKPVCRAPNICCSAVWNQLHMTPFGAHNFEVSARFFEKCFTSAICDLCLPRLHCCPCFIKCLVFAISDNAQNSVDIIAYDLQLTMLTN